MERESDRLERLAEALKSSVREELDLTAELGDEGVLACIDTLIRKERVSRLKAMKDLEEGDGDGNSE